MFAPIAGLQAEEISPLDRLRQRSANKRWEEIRSNWIPVQGQKLDGNGTQRTESEKDIAAPPRPIPNLEAGARSKFPEVADQSTLAEEATQSQNQESLSRPFPVVESARPLPKPAMMRSVPDPYASELPLAPESFTLPRSIHQPPAIAEQSTGSATLESTRPEALPVFQTPEPPELISPPVMTAQAIPDPTLFVPPAINSASNKDMKNMDDLELSIFRPITEIEPYHDYSPTGSNATQYLCPQPSNIPESERERCPTMESLPERGTIDRHFTSTFYHWQASNLTHNPLYFEDVSLERYGHTYPDLIQPFVSVGKFGLQVVGLPYQMALEPAWNDRYALGYYRPGEPAPHLKYRFPYNRKAAITAGAFYTGFFFLIP